MRFDHYILVEDKQLGLGISFIDLDETLFNTFAKILVKKDGKVVRSLTNQEFNVYREKEGESFDYSQFRNSKFFYDTSKPIQAMIKRASRIINHAENKGSKVIILTARADMDDKELFLNKFREAGIPIDSAYVNRAGNVMGSSHIPTVKKRIILGYLKDGLYRRVRMFDDNLATCTKFLTIKNEVPKEILVNIRNRYEIDSFVSDEELIHFEAWHVQPDGSISEVK